MLHVECWSYSHTQYHSTICSGIPLPLVMCRLNLHLTYIPTLQAPIRSCNKDSSESVLAHYSLGFLVSQLT